MIFYNTALCVVDGWRSVWCDTSRCQQSFLGGYRRTLRKTQWLHLYAHWWWNWWGKIICFDSMKKLRLKIITWNTVLSMARSCRAHLWLIRKLVIEGRKEKGRPKQTWDAVLLKDSASLGMSLVDPNDRNLKGLERLGGHGWGLDWAARSHPLNEE